MASAKPLLFYLLVGRAINNHNHQCKTVDSLRYDMPAAYCISSLPMVWCLIPGSHTGLDI